MHQTSNPRPQPATPSAIARARDLARASSARLSRIAARAGGNDGRALASRLVAMILSAEPPERWPISTMIDLLEAGEAGQDRQADRLLADLRLIESDLLPVVEAALGEGVA